MTNSLRQQPYCELYQKNTYVLISGQHQQASRAGLQQYSIKHLSHQLLGLSTLPGSMHRPHLMHQQIGMLPTKAQGRVSLDKVTCQLGLPGPAGPCCSTSPKACAQWSTQRLSSWPAPPRGTPPAPCWALLTQRLCNPVHFAGGVNFLPHGEGMAAGVEHLRLTSQY